MPTLLAIDAASILGWAFGPTDAEVPDSGFLPLGKGKAPSQQERFCGAMRFMSESIKVRKPDYIIIESPIFMGENTTFQTSELLLGVQACLRGTAQMLGHFRVMVEPAPSARSFFIPSPPRVKGQKAVRMDSEQKKALVRRRCIELGWIDPERDFNNDQTDALCMWAFGVSKIDQPNSIRFSPLFSKA